MFPFFAAISHTNYTKSVWMRRMEGRDIRRNMRRMEGRDIKNPKLLQKYLDVYHVLCQEIKRDGKVFLFIS